MSNADDIFWRRFGAILSALVLFGVVVAFIARHIAGDAFEATMRSPAAVAERIAPEGMVRVGDTSASVAPEAKPATMTAATSAPAASGGAGGGESVYNGVCAACHNAGVAGAPKLGDAEAWAPRIALGEDALVSSVVNGKNAMPPKGGNPSLSEDEIRAAVQWMVDKASPEGAAREAAAEPAKEAAAGAAEPAREAAAGTARATAEKATEAPAATTADAGGGKPGEAVYNMGCVACHATGVANAPKLGDKAAWEPRAAAGLDALVSSVINGKNAMPPKGGLASLEEADIRNAVHYMLEKSGVSPGG